eukprot:301682-Alexandrium_andersonii.AAC.1
MRPQVSRTRRCQRDPLHKPTPYHVRSPDAQPVKFSRRLEGGCCCFVEVDAIRTSSQCRHDTLLGSRIAQW